MVTVRFPGGFYVTYNNANYVTRNEGFSDLYVKKGGSWVAQVNHGSGLIIEVVPPCKSGFSGQGEALQIVRRDLKNYSGWSDGRTLAEIKKALRKFDAKSRRWKP